MKDAHVLSGFHIWQVELVQLLEFKFLDHLPVRAYLDGWLTSLARLTVVKPSTAGHPLWQTAGAAASAQEYFIGLLLFPKELMLNKVSWHLTLVNLFT